MITSTSRWGLLPAVSAVAILLGVGGQAGAQTLSARLFDVVYHNAPIIVAETYNGFGNPEAADHLLKVDFDCTPQGNDNATNIIYGSVCDGGPYAYFSIAETGTTSSSGYYFIGFYYYHPRQPSGTFYVGPFAKKTDAHDHDLEGVWFIVKKSPYTPYGTLYAAVTEAHGALIPFVHNPKDGIAPGVAAIAGPHGYLNFWYQPTTGITRPVVMIRAATHGTYMAQDYTDPDFILRYFWGGSYGIDPLSPQLYGTYRATIHGDSRGIFYMPMNGGCAPSAGCYRLGPSVRSGTWYYGLQEVATSPIWIQRATAGLFTGTLLDIGAAQTGLSYFAGNPLAAEPMWKWLGGRGSYESFLGIQNHWYSFGIDMTGSSDDDIWWPMSPTYGRLLTNPALEAGSRFTGLTELDAPMVYNAYGTTLNTRPPLPGAGVSVSIIKPVLKLSMVIKEGDYTWTSTVSDGSGGPYTYVWERDLYNNGNYYGVGQGASLTQHITCGDNGTNVALRLTVTSPVGTGTASNSDIMVDISPCPY
jgi:hypothetical protein